MEVNFDSFDSFDSFVSLYALGCVRGPSVDLGHSQ